MDEDGSRPRAARSWRDPTTGSVAAVSTTQAVKPDLRRAYLVLIVVGMASFITAMSLSIVFVVYPDLVEEFPNSSNSTLCGCSTS